MEIIVFDEDLQKTANSLLSDQFLMARVVMGKNGGYIAKDLIVLKDATYKNFLTLCDAF